MKSPILSTYVSFFIEIAKFNNSITMARFVRLIKLITWNKSIKNPGGYITNHIVTPVNIIRASKKSTENEKIRIVLPHAYHLLGSLLVCFL